VEIGYGIIPEAQNNGFATEAVKGIKEWAFSTCKVDKVLAECSAENIPSIKVLEKLDMKQVDSKDGMLYWEETQ
jgi:ribosomal-protein-alanine N-acetyltransferase